MTQICVFGQRHVLAPTRGLPGDELVLAHEVER